MDRAILTKGFFLNEVICHNRHAAGQYAFFDEPVEAGD